MATVWVVYKTKTGMASAINKEDEIRVLQDGGVGLIWRVVGGG